MPTAGCRSGGSATGGQRRPGSSSSSCEVTLPEPTHAAAYLRRLAAVDGYLAAAGERHLAGLAAHRTPVARLVRAAIDQIDRYLGAPDRDPVAAPLPPAGQPGAERLRQDAEDVLAGTVRPAAAGGLGQAERQPASLHRPQGDWRESGTAEVVGGADRRRRVGLQRTLDRGGAARWM